MHRIGYFSTPRLVFGGLGVFLVCLTFACGPAAAPAATPVAPDPFAVVRATSQAAYQTGKAHLDRGEFLPACVDLDKAKVADPDNRHEIQQALEEALRHCLTPVVEPTPSQRGIVVATLALVVPTVPAQGLPATPTPAVAAAKPSAVAAASPGATPGAGAPAQTGVAPTLVAWRDPQGRF